MNRFICIELSITERYAKLHSKIFIEREMKIIWDHIRARLENIELSEISRHIESWYLHLWNTNDEKDY